MGGRLYNHSVEISEKYLQVKRQIIFKLYGRLRKIELHLLRTALLSRFQSSPEALKSTE